MTPTFSQIGSVVIQFAVPDIDSVPEGLAAIPFESFRERKKRKKVTTGTSIFDQGFSTSVWPFVHDLANSGFYLVSAWFQERQISHERIYYIIRFTLVPPFFDTKEDSKFLSTAFDVNSVQFAALRDLSQDMFWRVRGYLNPATSRKASPKRPWFWSINPESGKPSKNKLPANYLMLNDYGDDFLQPRIVSYENFKEMSHQ